MRIRQTYYHDLIFSPFSPLSSQNTNHLYGFWALHFFLRHPLNNFVTQNHVIYLPSVTSVTIVVKWKYLMKNYQWSVYLPLSAPPPLGRSAFADEPSQWSVAMPLIVKQSLQPTQHPRPVLCIYYLRLFLCKTSLLGVFLCHCLSLPPCHPPTPLWFRLRPFSTSFFHLSSFRLSRHPPHLLQEVCRIYL